MKIGILTYHRTLNYGACLQAVATRIAMENKGHKAYYVDYWPLYHASGYKIFSWFRFKRLNPRKKIYYVIDTLKYWRFRRMRIKNFSTFHDKLIIPYCRPLTEEYDVILYGSDQIWRKQPYLGDYNPIYFGENQIKAKRHIAFAASMGILPKTEKDKKKISSWIKNFDELGVRELDLKCLLEEMGFSHVHLDPDPTLLLSAEEWNQVIPTKPYNGRKYALMYNVVEKKAFDKAKVEEWCAMKNLELKILSGTATKADTEKEITTADPVEFLRLVKNAEMVFTSSFHGLAFSIIYNRPFYCCFPSNSNRAITLLKDKGLMDRFLEPGADIPK